MKFHYRNSSSISRDLHGYKAKGDKFSDVMLFVISPNKFASCEQKKLTGNDIVQYLGDMSYDEQ